MEWSHGGDLAGYQLEYGRVPLDFSANVSPLGLPEGVQRAAERTLSESCAYPDPLCRALRQALAETLGLSAEQILCGSGASDLIYRLAAALRPKAALVTAPSFSEYEAALSMYGCKARRFPLREAEGFRLTEAFQIGRAHV